MLLPSRPNTLYPRLNANQAHFSNASSLVRLPSSSMRKHLSDSKEFKASRPLSVVLAKQPNFFAFGISGILDSENNNAWKRSISIFNETSARKKLL